MNSNYPTISSDPLSNKSQAWSALFNEPVSQLVQRYTASISFDKRLAYVDIQASLAHAQMLAECKIISDKDYMDIQSGMQQIVEQINAHTFEWKLELEDVHLNIEAALTGLIGSAGKRLHTGRSRNDQVATDIRLWLRNNIDQTIVMLRTVQRALAHLAQKESATVMPGLTHLQIAQPITFGHHLLAYVEMFERDVQRMQQVRQRVNQLPLGAAALAGTTYPINRHRVAELLNFEGICQNSLDAVSDRDFAIEYTAAAGILMMHISRLSEELIFWMNPAIDFIDIADRFTTGSSIMPQKKNPDIPELARGKTGRVYGHLIHLLTLMKAQPLAYNKDNQEDKEPLFDTVDTVLDTLHIFSDMIASLKPKPKSMYAAALKGYATATDLADYLVKKGLPFRDAHEIVAHAVKTAYEQQKSLSEFTLNELHAFSTAIDQDVYNCLSLEGSVAARQHIGGTAPIQVALQATRWLNILGDGQS